MTPKWMGWETVREIGSGSFGKVYEIQRTENGQTVSAALKVISIPESEQETREFYETGIAGNEQELDDYIESMVNDLTNEVETMLKLRNCKNIVQYDKHMIIRHDGWKGVDVLIKMELLTPLSQYMQNTGNPDEKQIIKLGLDICNALSYCHSQTPPILHRDIKPGNIMVDKAGNYKLGDFGVARVLEGSKSAHTKAGTESYMAPEVLMNTRGYGVTADIYSLGMMLYRLLNRNRVPFAPTEGSVSFKILEEAQARRLSNEEIPLPAYGSDALKQAIMKAVEFEPERRYQSAEEFGNALRACLQGNNKGRNSRPAPADDSTVRVAHGPQGTQSFQNSNSGASQNQQGQKCPQAAYQSSQGGYQGQPQPQASYEPQVYNTPQGSYGQIPQVNYPSYDNKPAKKKSKGLIALIAVIVVVLIAGGILAFTMLNKKVTMSWLDYDGSTITEKQVKKGTEEDYDGELPSRAEDEDYTYEFTGWDKAEDDEGNVTYTAKYAATEKIKYHTESWKNWDGTELKSAQVENGSSADFGEAIPIRAEDEDYTYEFTGWDKTEDAEGNVTYTAKYAATEKIKYHTENWMDWDGTELRSVQVENGSNGDYDGTTPVRAEDEDYTYEFTGWDKAEDAEGNVTYTAKYVATEKIKYHTENWMDWDGTGLKSAQVENGSNGDYDGTTPVRAEDEDYTYEFTGWDKAEDAEGNVTYTAKYAATEKIKYHTESWNDWDGTELKTVQVENGSNADYDGTAPSRAEDEDYTYEFTSWDKAEDAEGNVTYTAKYAATEKIKYHTESWVDWDGTILKTTRVKNGSSGEYDKKIPMHAEDIYYTYEFSKWNIIVDEKANVTYTAEYKTEKKASVPLSINTQIGDIVEFGRYEQDNDLSNGAENVEWLVLDKNGTRLLLLSLYALDVQPYHTRFVSMTWENCSLRSWLNNDFLYVAFNGSEQYAISTTNVTADPNPENDGYFYQGNDTWDKVFALSTKELDKYFPSKEKLMCIPTEYALNTGEYGAYVEGWIKKDENVKVTAWWSRTANSYNGDAGTAYAVYSSGYHTIKNDTPDCSVRPALWVETAYLN